MYYDRGGDRLSVTKYQHWQGEEPVRPAEPHHTRFNSSNNQMITINTRITAKLITSIELRIIFLFIRKIKSMNSAAYNSERITYHQISMYEYEFCTSAAINQNIDRINRLSWKFITIFAIKLYCSSILMQGIKKTKKCFKQFNHLKFTFFQGRYHLSLGRVKVFF